MGPGRARRKDDKVDGVAGRQSPLEIGERAGFEAEEEGEGEEITLGETAGLKVVGGHRGRSIEGAAGIAVNALDGAPRGDQAGYQDQAPASEGVARPPRIRPRLCWTYVTPASERLSS